MNLIIDIGNTRAKVAVFDEGGVVERRVTDHELKGLEELTERCPCQRGIVSTTAGLTEEAERRLEGLPFPTLRLTGETAVPISIRYKSPHTLGPDRLAAVVGAWAMKPGRDLLVIDCGTCVTYDFADHEGNYWGGSISPGLEMRLHALHEHTARLPLVGAEGEVPEVGYDTETAIRSGVVDGLRLEIEGRIGAFQKKYSHLSVFLTGGDAKKLGISKESCIFAPEIVLYGLNKILNYNK